MYPLEKIERAVRNTPGVVRAEGWITTEGALPKEGEAAPAKAAGGGPHGDGAAGMHGGGAAGGDRFAVIALPADTKLFKPEIVEGRWLQPGDTGAVVVNTALAAKGRMKAGERVVLRVGPSQMTWQVAGIVREPFSPSVAYISKAYLEQLGGHGAISNSLRVALEANDRATINRVKASLDTSLDQEQIRALSASSSSDSRFSFDQHMLMIYVFLVIMSGIIGGVGGLGLMTTISLNVLERRREMGVLRAIGASPAVVWLIVVAEGVVIGGLSWAVATLAAWPVSKLLGDLLVQVMFKGALDFFFDSRGPLVWLAVSMFFSVAASLLPAWHASRSSIREAVGYE
jgi:putative ABC transport system permease protein